MEGEPQIRSVDSRQQPRFTPDVPTFRAFLGKLLVGGACMLPATLAVDPGAGAQEAERVENIARTPLEKLIIDLDSENFDTRDKAQREIERRGCAHMEAHRKSPPWMTILTPGDDASAEVRRSLRDIRESIRGADIRATLDGTPVEPRAREMSVRALLEQLSAEAGCPVEFYGERDPFQNQRVTVRLGTFWEVVRSMHLGEKKDRHLVPYVSHSGAVDMHVRDRKTVLAASDGALYASLNMGDGNVKLFAEPKTCVEAWQVYQLHVLYPDGQEEDCSRLIRRDKQSVIIPTEFANAAEGARLQVTMSLVPHRVRRHTVDADVPCELTTPDGTVTFKGVSKTPDTLGAYHADLRFAGLPERGRVRCRGIDTDGGNLPAVTQTDTFDSLMAGFGRGNRPAKIAITITDPCPPYGSPGAFLRTLTFDRP